MPLFSNYTMCNMMTGTGLSHSVGGGLTMAWIAVVIIFFVVAFARKWIFEEYLQMPFSLIAAIVIGVLAHVFTVMLSCSYKLGLVVGLIGAFAAGYFGGTIFGEETW
jgi:hypothetical protein